jgi:hypothetical protein
MSHQRLLKQLVKQEGTDWGCFELPEPNTKRVSKPHVPFAVDHDAPQRACKVKKEPEPEPEPELTLQPVKKRKAAPAGEANAQARPKPAKTREPSVAQLQARAQAVVDADAGDAGEAEELARLRVRLAAAKAKESETREELAQLQQTLAQSMQAPCSSEELAAAVRAETQQLADDRALMAADIEAKNRTIATLQEQVDKAKGDCRMLKKDGQKLIAENARLASELNDRIFDLKEFGEIKADQAKLNDLLAESEEEVRQLRAQLGRVPSRDNASGRWSKRKRSEVSKAKGKRPMGADADSEDDEDAHPLLAVAGDGDAGADSDSSAEVGNDSSDDSEAAGAGSGEDSNSDDDDGDSDSEQAVRKKTKRAFVAFNKKQQRARAKAAANGRRRRAGARGSGDSHTRGAGKLSPEDKILYERPTGLIDRQEIDFSQVAYFRHMEWANKDAMIAWARDVFKKKEQKASGGPFKVQAALDLFALETPGTDHFANKDFEAFITYWANWQNTDTNPFGLQGKRHYLASLLYPETFDRTQKGWLFPKVDEESEEVSDEAKKEARRIDALKGKTNKYLQMIWWWNKHLNIGNIRVKNAL